MKRKLCSDTILTVVSSNNASEDLPLPLLIFLVQYVLVSVVIAQDHPLPYPPPFETIVINPLPHTYILEHQLPLNFTLQNVNGYSYLTRLRNQHIPQYCKCVW